MSKYYEDPLHPNYKRWQRSKELSFDRGLFVKSILEKEIILTNQVILDIGSGYGGTVSALSIGENLVVSTEIDLNKLKIQKSQIKNVFFVQCDVNALPFKKSVFDIMILQDVIEHLENFETIFSKLVSLIKYNGVIYLSTPNKLSIINILSDPHWGTMLIGLFKREHIRKYFLPYFRKSEINRIGIAQLMSLNYLINTFIKLNLHAKLHTTDALETLFTNPERILWSDFHYLLLKICKFISCDKILKKVVNNKFSTLNRFFTPTLYFTLSWKNSDEY